MPNHPPERDYAEGHYHNLEYLSFLDSSGFHEAWIGEHYTVPREPLPSQTYSCETFVIEK